MKQRSGVILVKIKKSAVVPTKSQMTDQLPTLESEIMRDIAGVMGVDEDMVPLLGKLARTAPTMNPWVRQLPGILRGLRLDRHSKILDIPCGCGAVSVPLAINYGLSVTGYDAFPPYIEAARQLAATKGVADQCSFQLGDIRQVVTIADSCDVLLWVAAPHLWDTTAEIIAQLRNCVRSGGTIVFADAYQLTPESISDFCTRDETSRQLEAHGDKRFESMIMVTVCGQTTIVGLLRRQRKCSVVLMT